MDDYLSKPLRAEDLDAVLERWLGEGPLIDDARVRDLRRAGDGLVDRLVDVFARTTPPLLEQLQAAVEHGDEDAGRKLAHKLRGSSDAVGARRLSELALRIEHQGGGAVAVADLERAFRASLDALRRSAVAT